MDITNTRQELLLGKKELKVNIHTYVYRSYHAKSPLFQPELGVGPTKSTSLEAGDFTDKRTKSKVKGATSKPPPFLVK